MRFELTVALKYLIPKWRQLSVSIISLISILVISLVVWLVVLFLSVTEGIEKKWIEELVALNAPLRMTPTEEYYRSYYYEIDGVALDSNYATKTIGEKLTALKTDPYDPRIDQELSDLFPAPDRYEDGSLKDLTKEGFAAIQALPFKGVRSKEYEIAFGNLRLQMLREGPGVGKVNQTFVSQVSYIASHDGENRRVNQMIIPPTEDDFNNLLQMIGQIGNPVNSQEDENLLTPMVENGFDHNLLVKFFNHLKIKELRTSHEGFRLPPSLFPHQGKWEGVGLAKNDTIKKVIVPAQSKDAAEIEKKLCTFGYKTAPVTLIFEEEQLHLSTPAPFSTAEGFEIILDNNISFNAEIDGESLPDARSLSDLKFFIKGFIQDTLISGKILFDHLEIAKAETLDNGPSLWVYRTFEGGCCIPSDEVGSSFGKGLLIAKHFKNNGVRLGDRGFLSYYAPSGSSMQEQRIPVYVAGFYNPGMMPAGNKLIFADPEMIALLRGNLSLADPLMGNGINIWLDHLSEAEDAKETLIRSLEARGIGRYWNVQSYHDYEFTKPILDQLKSDKNLFTLIAVIILMVACSNIISMLILLVNDKKKEIGILQALGSSSIRIGTIFGLCGFVTGAVSCIIGIAAALLTLENLQSIVNLLSFFQGHEAFQSVFYGAKLPNHVSYGSLLFVSIATLVISLLAGVIPAVKAARIRPTEILKSS